MELADEVRSVLVEELHLEDLAPERLKPETPLFGAEGLGLDSIDALELVVILKKRFKVEIKDKAAGELAQAAVVFGASSGGMLEGEDYYRSMKASGHAGSRRELLAGLEAVSTTSRVGLALGARGPRATFATACSSSAHALGHALD